MAQQIDQPITKLIHDLKQRNLFEKTLIVWTNKFEQTPYTKNPDKHNHNPYNFNIWLTNNNIKKKTIYGTTNEINLHTIKNKSTIYDL